MDRSATTQSTPVNARGGASDGPLVAALTAARARLVAQGVATADLDGLFEAAREAQRHEARVQILADVAHAFIEVTSDYGLLLDTIARSVSERVGDSCSVRLVSEDGEHLGTSSWAHPDPAWVEAARELVANVAQRLGDTFGGRVVQSGVALLVTEISLEDLLAGTKPELHAFMRRWPVSSLLCVPLRAQGGTIGVLNLSRTSPGRPYNQDDLRLALDIADRASLAITNARLLVELRRERTEINAALRAEIVERAKSEEMREQMRVALAQSEKLASLGLLSAGIAHEINNPLAYVGANLQVIDRDTRALLGIVEAYDAGRDDLACAAPAVAQRLETLSQEADLGYIRANLGAVLGRTRDGVRRITRIVEALRSLARTDPPAMVRASLPELVSASVEVTRDSLARAAIAVETAWDDDPTVLCVPTLLSQVLLNLLTNAVHAVEAAHPNGGGRIGFAARIVGDEKVIEVSDNGCGIAAESLPRIFDPFYTTRVVGEGTGLGLAISHSIIESHNGRIDVESRPGEGARFRIHLPLKPRKAPR